MEKNILSQEWRNPNLSKKMVEKYTAPKNGENHTVPKNEKRTMSHKMEKTGSRSW